MRLQTRISFLFFIGIFGAGSSALGYYYYFVYAPPLNAAEAFMNSMEARDGQALRSHIIISIGEDAGELRGAQDHDIEKLLLEPFERGRILDQRVREGNSRNYYYLVYREPDGRVYALVVTQVGEAFRVVIPDKPMSKRRGYLWDYAWTN